MSRPASAVHAEDHDGGAGSLPHKRTGMRPWPSIVSSLLLRRWRLCGSMARHFATSSSSLPASSTSGLPYSMVKLSRGYIGRRSATSRYCGASTAKSSVVSVTSTSSASSGAARLKSRNCPRTKPNAHPRGSMILAIISCESNPPM